MGRKDHLENRLTTLPRKTSNPFRRLLRLGLIEPELIETLLDASDLTGERSIKLLGFGLVIAHLENQGAAVRDTVRMAKELSAPISLEWSMNRWITEHERLSRIHTMHRLHKENTSYDVTAFASHLTDRFNGYLIRSSRRLGMEGFRQRSCIASYDQRIKQQQCAIASVFIDKQRYTVELKATSQPHTEVDPF